LHPYNDFRHKLRLANFKPEAETSIFALVCRKAFASSWLPQFEHK
jgi:hypothetical protein